MKNLLFNFCAASILLAFSSCSQTDLQEALPGEVNMESSKNNDGEDSRKFNSEKLRVFKGPQVQYGDGKLRSFVSLNDENFPVEIGFIMTPEIF